MKLKLTSLILCAAIVMSSLAGCSDKKDAIGKDGVDGKPPVTVTGGGAKGRYVETEYDLPKDVAPLLITEREDGSIDLYGVIYEKSSNNFVVFHSKDLVTWEEQKPAWIDDIKNSQTGLSNVNGIAQEKSGSLLVMINDKEHAYRVYRVTGDTAAEIPMESWDLPAKMDAGGMGMGGSTIDFGEPVDENENVADAESKEAYNNEVNATPKEGAVFDGGSVTLGGGADNKAAPKIRDTIYPMQIVALDDGNFIIPTYGKVVLHDGKTGAELKSYGEGMTEIVVLSNKIYRLNQERTDIEVIDIQSGSTEKKLPLPKNTQDTILFTGNDDAIYAANKSGVSRMVSGGSVWETIIDGGLSVLSIPSMYLRSVAVGKDRSFYMTLISSGSPKLYKAVYDPEAPAVPDTEITVYSLYDNSTIRQAIGEFQQANPTVMVNFRVGIDSDSSATPSDIIRALNVEILAGKAPDVLILDNLPSESYIEKGVLTDLTEFYNNLSKTEKFIEPVITSYQKDSKLYALPARFKMPVIFGEEELLSKINKLSDLNSDYGSKTLLMSTGEIEQFLNDVMPTSYSEWIDESGALDTAKLTEFLTDIKSVYDKYKPKTDSMSMATFALSATGSGGMVSFETKDMDFMTGRTQLNLSNAVNGNYISTMIEGMALAVPIETPKLEKKKTSIKLAPGQAEGAYTPSVVAGITATSKQKEIAESFLTTLLSQSVQNCGFDDGFAVNEKSFDLNNMTIPKSEDDTPKELPEVKALLSQLKTPVFIDSVVFDAVKTSATSLLKGESDIQKAITDIKSKVDIYLAE